MDRKRALLQLRIVLAVLRQSRRHGTVSPELRQRAVKLVETAAIEIDWDSDADDEWQALLKSVRLEIADG